jgi:phenylalanine-4-hydroxylase
MLQEAIRKKPAITSECWQDYVIPQCWEAFSAEDHRVWDILFERQVAALGERIVTPFREGLDLLHLSHPGIPDLIELNAKLKVRTGWETVAVPGLVPDAIFFAMLAKRIFPVGNFIRTFEQLDYLEEPDLFHDIFGHVPMLSHPGFAAMIEHMGRLGLAVIAAGHGEWAARLYWHSVEFSLAREGGELKILGAGLASSFGEFRVSLDSNEVARPRFTISDAIATPYHSDAFQPLYMVSDNVDGLSAELLGMDLAVLERLARGV